MRRQRRPLSEIPPAVRAHLTGTAYFDSACIPGTALGQVASLTCGGGTGV